MSESGFSKRSVGHGHDKKGRRRQVFIFYHSTTDPDAAESILRNGFRKSSGQGNMLGEGIYVAKDLRKALPYGPITFKLLVSTGRIIKIDRQGHPMQKSWQHQYNSAWVPPNCGMVQSGLQENCIRDPQQIMILGVIRGFDLLSPRAKRMTNDLSN